jgi:hypothetical protein
MAAVVAEMEVEEREMRERLRRGERLSSKVMLDKKKAEKEQRLMSGDVDAMREVLERYDETRGKTENTNRDDNSFFGKDDVMDASSSADEEEVEEEAEAKKNVFTPLDISTPASLHARLALYATQYQHHREISEAALLHSGYTQCDVVEIISDDIVDKIVSDVVAEVDETLVKQSEQIIRGL